MIVLHILIALIIFFAGCNALEFILHEILILVIDSKQLIPHLMYDIFFSIHKTASVLVTHWYGSALTVYFMSRALNRLNFNSVKKKFIYLASTATTIGIAGTIIKENNLFVNPPEWSASTIFAISLGTGIIFLAIYGIIIGAYHGRKIYKLQKFNNSCPTIPQS